MNEQTARMSTRYSNPSKGDCIDEKSIKKGNRGEEHFLDFELWNFFGLHRSDVEDLRGNKREGEIRLPDGRLVEIKSDHSGNMERYGNMIVEIIHEEHKGWYHHCKRNGVTNLIVEAFNGEGHPYFVLHVPFDELEDLIEAEGHTFGKTGDGCLKVPVRRILETCVGASALPLIRIDQAGFEHITNMIRNALQTLRIDGQIREEDIFTQIKFQYGENDLCNSQLPEDHPVFSTTPTVQESTKK